MAACRSCGADVPEAAKFCPACGAAVAGPSGEERKVVTVVFADLVASTAQADARDPEDVRAAVAPQLARMRDAFERYGGTFEKYVGDAVMAVFGAPVSHEDDPARAVRAALAIRDSIGGVRVAVNTGEAVVTLAAGSGTGEGIATGDVVNTTFRIEEAAAPNTVLVGEPTYRLTRDVVEFGDSREIAAKGKAAPVTVYEALRAPPEALHADVRPLAPLVGRKEELSLILDTLARAKRDGTAHLVTIVGDPGIGKSRLVWELERALEQETGLLTWRRGRCLPYGDRVTFWALAEIAKAQTGILETDDPETTETKLRRGVRDVIADPGEATWAEKHLRPLVGLAAEPTAGERREAAFGAWRRFFEALAEWGPLVLVLEDIHWADEGLLDFLDTLLDWGNGPMLLLCTARPELLESRETWGARRNAATIALPPLSLDETKTLVRFLLRQPELPTRLQQALLDRAEGNPLYAEEFIRMLVDRGFLRRADGGWQLTGDELPVPDSVHGIVASRLDALTSEKTLLHDAAVLGRTFWVGALAAMADTAPADVEAQLRSLEQKELVRRQRSSSVEGELEYVFHHSVVRDVAYGQIPRAKRSEKHRAVAAWLESISADRLDRAELLAHHLWKASVLASAAGRTDATLEGRAREALREAGERALALNAFEAAGNYFDAAIGLARENGVEHGRLLAGLGKARAAAGSGVEELERASAELLEHGDRRAAAEADVLSARLLLMQGRHAEASERFDRALELLGADAPSAEKATVLATVAGFRMATDRGAEAIELGREALAMADELELPELQIAARTTIGTARGSTGDAGGVDDLEESIRIATDVGSPEIVRAYLNLGSVVANLGDVRRAAELHARGRVAAERFGDPTRLRWFDAERLYSLYWTRRWDEALELVDELLDQIGEGAPHVAAFDAHLVRGWIRLERGDLVGATGEADAALELGRSFEGPQLLYPALAFAARTRFEAGDSGGAAGLADELLEAWATTRATTLPSFWVGELAFVLRSLGRGDELAAVSDGAPRTRWLDAALAVASGEDVVARRVFNEIGSRADEERLAAGGR